jgi:hypothetical protein
MYAGKERGGETLPAVGFTPDLGVWGGATHHNRPINIHPVAPWGRC